MIGIGLLCAGGTALGQTQSDVARDFSLDGNPNGAWYSGIGWERR